MMKPPSLWWICICLPILVHSQGLHFESAFKEGEIPQVPTSLLQDSNGFIWVGTTDGVYRYDGKEVREFRHDPLDSTTISNNSVKMIHEDQQGNIWFGTRYGLNRYNPRQENIQRFIRRNTDQISNENHIHSIIDDHKGRIWYGTYNGLFQLDPNTKELKQFLPSIERENTLSNKLVWWVFEDMQQRIWVATHEGFTIFKNDDTYKFIPYYGDLSAPKGLKTDRVFKVIQQPDSTIWLSSYQGVFRVIEDQDSLQFQHFSHNKNQVNTISDDRIFDLIAEGNDRIWAGTWARGLNEILLPKNSTDTVQIIRYRNDPLKPHSLSMDRIEALLIDQSGLFWVGTGNRVDKVSKNAAKFQTLQADVNNQQSLSNNIIRSVFKDSFGNLWVGTYSGLNFLSADNLRQQNFVFEQFKYTKDDPYSISHNNIQGFSEDSRGYLWINTFHGLNYIHIPTFLKDKRFRHFDDRHGIPHTINRQLYEVKQGVYWVTCDAGLARMDFDPEAPEKVRFENLTPDTEGENSIVNTYTISIIQDRFGAHWIGTFNGVSKCVNKDGGLFFENYIHESDNSNSLSDNSFRCFFKDSKERLWIGTRSGLNLVQQEQSNQRASFKVYGSKDGFPNDVIHAIEEDQQGQLWISTNRGLIVFDPEAERPVRKVYNNKDGLSSSSFVFRSSFKEENGTMYFGTASGLNYFNPEAIPFNNYVPPLRFTELKVLNEVIKPSKQKNAILQQSITYCKTLTLKHWQNIITLEFAALDFNRPEKNQYQYRLSSLNKEWIHNGNKNDVTFTNLAPGKHTLLVKGSNNDGLWNEKPLELVIQVLPPLWKTWWAYGAYLAFFIGIIYWFIRFRSQQRINKIKAQAKLEKARLEERELLRNRNAADFHDELGHRFTKISLFLELAKRQSNIDTLTSGYLEKIKKHTSGLSEGIRDLIWSLDPQKDSLYETLIRLQEFGDQLFDFSEIHFKTSKLEQTLGEIELAPDVRKNILLIFKEAMNNCLKYSMAKNAVFSVTQDNDQLVLSFQDDGKGFERETIKSGYGLKNMHARAQAIKANLSLHSALDQGTTIQLILSPNP